MKECRGCNEEKSLDEFWRMKASKDGRQPRCIKCQSERNAARKGQPTPESAREYKRDWHQRNKNQVVEKVAEWRENNLDRSREIAREGKRRRYHANPEVARTKSASYQATRRARKKGAGVVEQIDRREVYERDGGICHICDTPVEYDDMHLDHVIPLAKGGAHTHDNVATSHSKCNVRKGASIVPLDTLKDPFRARR